MQTVESKNTLDFGLIANDLDRLLTAFKESTIREWPRKWEGLLGAGLLVQGSVRVASTAYQVVRFICKDTEKYRDPWQRLEFVTATPPIVRSILDILFALVFLFDDVPTRSEMFIKGGWREMCEESERMARDYGSNPKWSDYLRERASRMEDMRALRNLPPCGEETKKLPYWPNPGQMLRLDVELSAESRAYIEYLRDWYYKELSSADHLSFPGLLLRGSPLMLPDDDSARLNLLRFHFLESTLSIVMAIMSEIQVEAGFGHGERLKYVWAILNQLDNARELYELRYKNRL
jgi:hypothetical protein